VVVTHAGNEQYIGLSTDTKPATSTSGARFFAYNTNQSFVYNGTAWINDNVFAGSITLASGASGINFSGMQMLPSFALGSYSMWISGSVYRVMNNQDGTLLYSGTNPTSGLMTAIQNIGYGSASLIRTGGTINIKKGGYNFPATIKIDQLDPLVSGVTNITIAGEGRDATDLFWQSGSVDGFHVNANFCTFKDMTLRQPTAAAPPVTLIHIIGQSGKNANANRVDNCSFEGANAIPSSGQYAIIIEGTTLSTAVAYNNKITNSHFEKCDAAIYLMSGQTNANFGIGLDFTQCNIGILQDSNSQCTWSDMFLQGNTSGGIALIELRGSAVLSQANNLAAETFLSGSSCVLASSGSNVNSIGPNIQNSNFNNNLSVRAIWDNTSTTSGYVGGSPTNRRNVFRDGHIHPISGITVGASPFIFTNNIGTEIQVTVGGGTVSEIRHIRLPNTSGVILSGMTGGTFMLHAGDAIQVTYSAAPGMFQAGF